MRSFGPAEAGPQDKEERMNCPACGKNGLKEKTLYPDPFDLPCSSYSCFERLGTGQDLPCEVTNNICDSCGFSISDEDLKNPEKLAQKLKAQREKQKN